jgi:ATP-dependent protease ClpP protease subunit
LIFFESANLRFFHFFFSFKLQKHLSAFLPILEKTVSMNTENFKHIVGAVQSGEAATIRFFGRITEESASQFNSEFNYLECCIRPKLIRVLINSEGGSVLHGMAVYSTIQNSTVPTECIIEGMAASMASILWAAGNKSLMRDYSILGSVRK